ncbi:MAG: hypothetical protein BWY54_00304 [Candidatus Dependentiae bacterium ADurb.Bin331]|nr:MAG: hypothetical protein BWY54_00304 [Candidatus Dependentiae bacterium ADurb.Bin331]
MTSTLRKPSFFILVILFVFSGALSVRFIFNYYTFWHKLQSDLQETITLGNKTVGQDFTNQLSIIDQLAAHYTQQVKSTSQQLIIDQSKQFLMNQELLSGLIIVPTTTAHAVELVKKESVIQLLPESIATDHNTWSDPYFSTSVQQWVITHWFGLPNDERIGFIIPLSFLKNILSSAHADSTSYSVLTDKSGNIIAHQFDHYVPMKNTIFDQLNIEHESTIGKTITQNLQKNAPTLINYKDAAIGQSVWLATAPVHNTSWTVSTIAYPYNFVQQSTDQLRQHIIKMSASLLITVCLLFIIVGSILNTFFTWWIMVILISFACMAELGFLWYVGFTRAREKHVNYKMVVDNAQLQAFINVLNQQNIQTNKPFLTIPTGIFFENVEFTREANELLPIALINGYLWQQYTKGVHDRLERSFLLPDAFNLQTKEISHIIDGMDERICWQFSCKIYETVTLLTYPFDHRHLNLRIAHPQQLSQHILLIPDFGSYELMNPSLLPGLSRAIKIPHWNIYTAFFDYRLMSYKTTLGLAQAATTQPIAQLNFSFIAQRQLIGEFITYLILIVMSLIILFILLLSFSKKEQYVNLIGFTNLNILTVLSGLLFVLILSHISLRQTTDIIGISYMESFYFICYLYITAMAINSSLFIFNRGGRFIQYEHNLIPKLIYWPLFLLLTIAATIITFY